MQPASSGAMFDERIERMVARFGHSVSAVFTAVHVTQGGLPMTLLGRVFALQGDLVKQSMAKQKNKKAFKTKPSEKQKQKLVWASLRDTHDFATIVNDEGSFVHMQARDAVQRAFLQSTVALAAAHG